MADYWCDDGWDKLPLAANEARVKADAQSPPPQDKPMYRQKPKNCQFSLNKEEKLHLKASIMNLFNQEKNMLFQKIEFNLPLFYFSIPQRKADSISNTDFKWTKCFKLHLME